MRVSAATLSAPRSREDEETPHRGVPEVARRPAPEYGHALQGVLGEEIAKDFVTMPVHEIERLLTGNARGTS